MLVGKAVAIGTGGRVTREVDWRFAPNALESKVPTVRLPKTSFPESPTEYPLHVLWSSVRSNTLPCTVILIGFVVDPVTEKSAPPSVSVPKPA